MTDLKDNSAMWDMDTPLPSKSTRGTNTCSSLGLFTKNGSGNITIEDTVKNGLSYLARHRAENKRPEDLEVNGYWKLCLCSCLLCLINPSIKFQKLNCIPSS